MAADSSFSARVSKNTATRYGVAFLVTVIALLVRWALNRVLGDYVPYITLFPAVAFSAWYCGIGPSIVTVLLSLLAEKYWFTTGSHVVTTVQSAGVIGFLFGSALVVAMGETRRRSNEILRRAEGELEIKVKQRTVELDMANQSLRDLSARLLQLQDDERRRIARELHDSVGQLLAALSMNLSAVGTDIERLAKTARTLTDSEALIQEMNKEVRTISHLLHPPLLDEAGLAAALRWYAEGFARRSNIKVSLKLPDDLGRLSRELETAIFRTVQECLTNIHRHSGSPVAKIRINRSDSVVLVEVADEGKGIPAAKRADLDTVGTPGVGICGMRERLRQLGGHVEINSDGKGTVVVARLPIASTPAKATA